MTFELPISDERVKPHQVTALHLFVAFILVITASLVLVSYYAASHMPEDSAERYKFLLYYGPAISAALYAVSLILIIIVVAKNRWLQKPVNNTIVRILEFLLILMILIACVTSKLWVPTVIYTVLASTILMAINWERKKDIPLTIHVDSEGIKPPITSRVRKLEWKDIEHVILRFNTLTVNCADNRLYQWNVHPANFETDVFEVFCIRQVDKAKENRDKNDW